MHAASIQCAACHPFIKTVLNDLYGLLLSCAMEQNNLICLEASDGVVLRRDKEALARERGRQGAGKEKEREGKR